jgi:hypothetical protein
MSLLESKNIEQLEAEVQTFIKSVRKIWRGLPESIPEPTRIQILMIIVQKMVVKQMPPIIVDSMDDLWPPEDDDEEEEAGK